jgi:hypothetical protein
MNQSNSGANMPKTVTLRLPDKTYKQVKTAAISENRSISNYIETHLLEHLFESEFVDDVEMSSYDRDPKFSKSMVSAVSDIKKKKYKIVA